MFVNYAVQERRKLDPPAHVEGHPEEPYTAPAQSPPGDRQSGWKQAEFSAYVQNVTGKNFSQFRESGHRSR
jgi:hypothetical protein